MKIQNTVKQELCSIPCNLCGSVVVSVLANHSRSGEPLRTLICRECGLAWSDPLPHNPRDFYEKDYRVSYKGSYSPQPKHILRAGNVAISRYRKIENFLEKPLAILDVGSGGGEFLYLLQSLGHQVQGIEPNKGYAEYSIREYELNINVGFVQELYIPQQSFDLITIWHVLEHTENPFAVLTKLNTLLKPQGILVVEVPNIEAICQSPKSTFHEAHLFHFNIATLTRLAEKAGFTETSHVLSADAGNITLFLQKVIKGDNNVDELNLYGNAERISKIISNHTHFIHYLSINPYVRLLHRIRRFCIEKNQTSNFTSGRQLLDHCYEYLHNQAH
jgi:2-polyprenyl-3-methyl-5-hydroxy-6-metoxy-1,4-benzoquinol methylase